MKRTILLVSSAVFVAACVGPRQNPPVLVSGDAAKLGSSAVVVPHSARAAQATAPWAAYREFNFAASSIDISTSETPKLREIVAYVASDSSLDVGIDDTSGTDGASQAERDISTRRATAVRRALMDTGAGIASYKILIGPFGAPERRRSGQIQVLIGPRTGSPLNPL